MRFGSVCSGIEAASVAWNPLGWKAAWLSEIEPFPSAVLEHHYPDVPNLGDMTTLPERIRSGEVEAPDLFCGGTPCQAFSVAGLRKSLDDARGNLSLTFCEIANAIDDVRSVRGGAPAIIFWENVPGVLSTKDNAFGCFLAGLAGEDDPIVPPGEKWQNAGCVLGPTRTVAWRILDAQYFGVAQRRRRVFVVASARNDFDPVQVLFEFDGVRRDTAPSREAGQTTASGPGTSAAFGGMSPVAGTLTANTGGMTRPAGNANELDFCVPVVGALTAKFANTLGAPEVDAGLILPAQPMVLMDQGGSVMNVEHDMVGTLRRETHGHEPVVMQPIALQDVTQRDKSQNGKGWSDDGISCTVDTHATQGVAQPIGLDEEQNAMIDAFGTLKARTAGGGFEGSVMQTNMQVRRLTPVECERLQGFPDNYTAIPWRKKPASECPDGPRYKALGNSWAVPVVRWIGKRIQEAL